MLVLFVIVAAAVLTVTWSRWENVSTSILRTCCMLSIALGVRTVALMTALFLVPLVPQFAWSDEPAPVAAAEESDDSPSEPVTPAEPKVPAEPQAAVAVEPAAH